MSVTVLLIASALAVAPDRMLILEKIGSIRDPRAFDLRDPVAGDRGVPWSCGVAGETTVTLVGGRNAKLEVERGGTMKSIELGDARGLERATLACGEDDRFFYVNPRSGRIQGFSANRLFGGSDPVVWAHAVTPFKSVDEVGGILIEASVATEVQIRQRLVLVEWFYRKRGRTEVWLQVYAHDTGAEVGKLGPSDLLIKTSAKDTWWVLFQGGGDDNNNYVPQNLYRLRYGPLTDPSAAAEAVAAALGSTPQRQKAVATLSPNPVINHMIALLSPTRTSPSATIEFCPVVPVERARYWLGGDYDELLGGLADRILLAFWMERQSTGSRGNPIDDWFQSEIAPREPMKTVLAHFDPQDDQWVAAYQQALLALGGATFERLFEKYGVATGAVVRTPSKNDNP